jgi:hypothetical protein
VSYSTDTKDGWMPGITDKVKIPSSNFHAGMHARYGGVLHIMNGSYGGTISWFQNPSAQVSAHFGVAKDGRIAQFVSIKDTAYGNGLAWSSSHNCWVDPQGHYLTPPNNPTWVGLTPPTDPNFTTISIEQEGYAGDPPMAAQQNAVASILRYLAAQYPGLAPWVHGTTLIGHCDLSTIEKVNCPGPTTDWAKIVQLANGVMKYAIVAPCSVFTSRSPTAPLAPGPSNGQTQLAPGTIVNLGDITDGWGWVSDGPNTEPGIGFLPMSYLKPA